MQPKMQDTKNEMFEYKNGTYTPFGKKTSEFGYTIKLFGGFSTPHINLADEQEAIDTVMNHVENYEKIKANADAIGEYCKNNAWTRMGT